MVGVIRRLVEGKKGMAPDAVRKARPTRNPVVTWIEAPDGSAQLTAPLAATGKGFWAAMARKAGKPDEKTFELEPVGAFVWNLCDGKHSFETIARKLQGRFKMNRLEAETALLAFLQMLGRKRLITLSVNQRTR